MLEKYTRHSYVKFYLLFYLPPRKKRLRPYTERRYSGVATGGNKKHIGPRAAVRITSGSDLYARPRRRDIYSGGRGEGEGEEIGTAGSREKAADPRGTYVASAARKVNPAAFLHKLVHLVLIIDGDDENCLSAELLLQELRV